MREVVRHRIRGLGRARVEDEVAIIAMDANIFGPLLATERMAARVSSSGWIRSGAITVIRPAAWAEATPVGESSMATQSLAFTPSAFSETIVASLPPALVQFERFSDCGHGVVRDAPERHFQVLREFMLR